MNGLKIQWGKWIESQHQSGDRHINFLINYTNDNSVIINLTNIHTGTSNNETVIVKKITSTFCFFDSCYNRDVFWIAIGY